MGDGEADSPGVMPPGLGACQKPKKQSLDSVFTTSPSGHAWGLRPDRMCGLWHQELISRMAPRRVAPDEIPDDTALATSSEATALTCSTKVVLPEIAELPRRRCTAFSED